MKQGDLMNYAAIGLGVVAVLYVLRTPGKAIAATSGQQQRDQGLAAWFDVQRAQFDASALSQGTTLDYLNKRHGLGIYVPEGWSITDPRTINLMN